MHSKIAINLSTWLCIGLSFICSLHAEDFVDKRAIFMQFQNFYEALHPAQEKNENAYAWFSNVPHPFLNVIIHLSSDNAAEKIDALIAQNVLNNPMTVWVHPENHAEGLVDTLQKRNFNLMVTCPAMTWKVQSMPVCEANIRPADKEIFYDIVSTAYQVDESVRRECVKLLDSLDCENYLFYVDEKPISTASVFVCGPVGEVFNDATLTEGGVTSKEMMQFLMHRAHELGLERLIVLSYPEAEEMYRELGFETLFNVEVYSNQKDRQQKK